MMNLWMVSQGLLIVSASGTRRRPVTNSSLELSKKESKKPKSSNLEDALYSLSKSLNAKAESSLACAERRRKIEEEASSKSDPYSVAECMQILQSMPDIVRACFLKAMEKFLVLEWR
ncbi:hypothetical protein TorRG33x02_209330 [Trema orientale]|uniref:Uncharacterized protein n=1 Tax=Trema orientale TaxID=63057 RepID=A0A2P5ECF7_TREOI|nr:hypothetical protein TorRG33x02_209330 [Trema orientale]